MIENICDFLTLRIRKEMPDIDDERAEVINYGLQLIIGELPKLFIMVAIAFLLGVGELSILSFLIIMPYRAFSGGFHLKTHIGCIVCTLLIYCGNVFFSKIFILPQNIKYVVTLLIFVFGIIMITKYAPADTENVPIISKKERKKQKIMSYITFTIILCASLFIKDSVISNMCIYGMLIQTLCITRLAYKITQNNYGYEIYNQGCVKKV